MNKLLLALAFTITTLTAYELPTFTPCKHLEKYLEVGVETKTSEGLDAYFTCQTVVYNWGELNCYTLVGARHHGVAGCKEYFEDIKDSSIDH